MWRTFLVGSVVVVSGCERAGAASRFEVSALPVAALCRQVSGADLGALPLELELGSKTVRFAEWTMVDERSASVVGFAAQVPAGVSFTVRAGDETFHAQGSRWLHPRGVAGPRVHAIDSVTFCALETRPVLALAP
jgi:hypothetical protein